MVSHGLAIVIYHYPSRLMFALSVSDNVKSHSYSSALIIQKDVVVDYFNVVDQSTPISLISQNFMDVVRMTLENHHFGYTVTWESLCGIRS